MKLNGLIRNYRCFNDCRQVGCPGHKLRMIYDTVSDTISCEIDGERYHTYDPNEWRAMKFSVEGWDAD